MNSWSLTRAKPEPSIENYIVQIDGRLKKDPKAPVPTAAAPVGTAQQNKVQTKRKLTQNARPPRKEAVNQKRTSL